MENMEKLAADLIRFTELETRISELDAECTGLKEDLNFYGEKAQTARSKVNALENPGLFTRLLGRVEEKRESAWQALRDASAAQERARQSLQNCESALESAKAEYEDLRNSKTAYESAKASYLFRPDAQEEFVIELDTAIIRAQGIQSAGRILSFLEEARGWMEIDAVRKGVSEGNRKLEFLSKAASEAEILHSLLSQLPGNPIPSPNYLLYPEHYITQPTSEFAQLDRLNLAFDHVRSVRNQLREL